MASDASLQFKEPAHPHISLHPSSNTDSTANIATGTVDPTHNSKTTKSPPPIDRKSSVGKVAEIAKKMVKSPQEEKEQLELEKTLHKEAKKGKVDVEVLEA